MAAVTILCWENPGAMELNLMKIVKFLGGTPRLVTLTAEFAGQPERLERLATDCRRLIVGARTLTRLGGETGPRAAWQPLLARLAPNILVLGFEPGKRDSRLLEGLTSGAILGVQELQEPGRKINVTRDLPALCRQLSGLSFDAVGSAEPLTFIEAEGQGTCSRILAAEEAPFFVRLNAGDCSLLLLAGKGMANLDAAVPEGTSILEFFPSVVPVLMFLHASARDEFWHNDRPGACFIVDDPLLKRRYGFLNYGKLLELMERKRFSTSIAFIPWNHRKSHPQVAQLVASRPRSFSLCVHGCEHTRGEFGGTELGGLRAKAQQALDWMRLHREMSGVEFDEVMVFPQGIFSRTALEAIKACGYLAGVNSTPYPVDAPHELTLRDLLQVAVTRFSNFPLFTRRYPQKLAELAFDLFLGKPALVVEHHGFFRNGYEALSETVEQLYRMDERLEWGGLAAVCSQACLKKAGRNGEIQVQFFTNRFTFRNGTHQAQRCVLSKATRGEAGDLAVAVNGRQKDIQREADAVSFELSLEAGQTAEITVATPQLEPMVAARRPDRLHQAKVFLRRGLSEFRDNYLDTHPFLSRAVRGRQ